MLLHAGAHTFQTNRPIDYFQSATFNAPESIETASRNLPEPFTFAHLVECRKALAFIIATLNNDLEGFGFALSSTVTRELREAMNEDKYDTFLRHILDLARLTLPIN